VELPGYQLRARRLADGGDEKYEINCLHPWYRRATERERSGPNVRESEHLDSTDEVGEHAALRGPAGGKQDATSNNRCWELRRVHRNLNSVSTKQHRIAELAKRSPELVFTRLNHLIDMEWLLEAYRRTRKDGAVGVDGQSAAEYEANLRSCCMRQSTNGTSTIARTAFDQDARRIRRSTRRGNTRWM
jgi:hypothetical protein